MGLIAKRRRFTVGGQRVVIRFMTLNIGFYRRYGTVVIVRASRRARRRKDVRVAIQNYYGREVRDGTGRPVIELYDPPGTRSRHARRTRLSQFSIGQTLDFGIVGVHSSYRIRIDGDEHDDHIADGRLPEGFVAPEPPRIDG